MYYLHFRDPLSGIDPKAFAEVTFNNLLDQVCRCDLPLQVLELNFFLSEHIQI